MEGTLWKWTNYWSGWQMRWFILDNGVLSYYKSQEEVNQGCKGSMKVSACEIIGKCVTCQSKLKACNVPVHPHDCTRLDLAIPGEQHIYLKAPSSQERQQWLVALGSSKACVTTRSRHDCEPRGDTLKTKRSELRLYCDMLMQQVHQVKSCTTDTHGPDVDKLNEATSTLSVTCDTFIKTLDECMKISDANFLYELPHQHVTDTALPFVTHNKIKPTIPIMKRSSSCDITDMKHVHDRCS